MPPFLKRWQSIDSKAPLLASALVVGTVLVVAITAHFILERALMRAAQGRMLGGAKVVAALISGPSMPSGVRSDLEGVLRDFHRGAATREHAIQALARGNSTVDTAKLHGALVDTNGNVLVSWHRSAERPLSSWARDAIARHKINDSVSLGPIEDLGGPTMSLAHALRATAQPDAPVIGYVTYTRATTGRAEPVRRIVGSDVQLLIGQIGQGVWTDLERVLPSPPAPHAGDSVVVYDDGVGAYARIAGTNLRVWLSQSREAIIAPSRRLMFSMIPVGLFIALISAALMWRFTRSITRPIAQLTDAAENVAADNGDTGMQPTVLIPATANEVVRLRYAFERMARRVSERQTLEMQLRHAQKMEAVGRLAGGVAHDFNNLLTAIRSYADLLIADTPEWDEKRADLLEIRKASERAAALTAQLLAFSRKQMLQPRVLDSAMVLVELRAMLERVLSEDVQLALELAPDLWPVKADRGQLEQVIVNLAVNARDAMPHGGVIRVAAMNDTLEHPIATRHGEIPVGQYISISVTDTGIGMDLKTQNQVFEPFFTTKPMGHGTGLGLATVHGIIAQSGGFVRVQSELHKGTTFTVYLPRVHETPKISGSQMAVPETPRHGSETILLVEDEQAVRALSRRVLERSGFRVLEAETPSVALALAGAHASQIELIVSDVVMPEMNGPALVARISELCPSARVLFISGYTDDEIIGRGLSEPGMLLLPKPFSAQELVEHVRQALDARPAGVSA